MRPEKLDENWDCPFTASPYWLRFELGGETFNNIDQPVPRFAQAFHRAQTGADLLFSQSAPLTAILATTPASLFSTLDELGFRAANPWCRWSAALNADGPEGVAFSWRAIDLIEPTMRDTLLWASIVNEMPIAPKAPVLSWLVDFEAGVTLHVYDDRGMDVRALTRGSIESLYRQFDAWLLDYDRPRMTAAFE